MVGFDLTPEQEEIRALAASFAKKAIRPVARDYDEREEVPWEVIKKAHQAGLMNLTVPADLGGQGLDNLTSVVVTEELAAGCAGMATILGSNGLALTPLLLAGTDEQKKRLIPPITTQPRLAAFCLTEPGAGSDAGAVATLARKVGDDYVLTGSKCFITNGGIADLYLVVATVDRTRGARGLAVFAVPAGTPGLSAGKKERKMGIRCSQTAEVVLEEVKVPKQNLIGREGAGFKIVVDTLDRARPGVGAIALGIARAALEAAAEYAGQRVQFGKPIGSYQAIQVMLADIATELEAARLLVWRAAWLLDQGRPVGTAAAMAKYWAGDVAMRAAVDAVQIFGGYGYMRDYPVEKLMRDAKITQIYEGTNQIQRLIVARSVLKGDGA
ncbi:MAG: acyl-CoA dehydrogenase family protein [Acetobacteraceae bacterium]|nr:acyl-CoA dehydrogenase family protein [Acetobacteraceae bacterium]